MPDKVTQASTYAQLSGSANVQKGQCELSGIFCSSASNTPTIAVYDDPLTGTTNKIVDTFTPVAGTWYQLPFKAGTGLNVVISGTVSCTVGYNAGG